MTLFTKKALVELSKREQEMSKPRKTLKTFHVREVRQKMDEAAKSEKLTGKTADKPEPVPSY